MNNSQVSKSYAKAISEIAADSNVNFADEITKFSELISSSNELESLLFLDVFTADERVSILDELFAKSSFSPILINFVKFLILEKRFNLFNTIFKEIVIMEDLKLGFISGIVEGSDENPDNELLGQIKSYLEEKLSLKTKINYKLNKEITAGYKATIGDLQIDATIENQLKKFKQEILNK
jgi:F-type H+-transporting ATPase subunit delta